ncbi:hypothetical protein BLOT_005453 [Blomia tropicalis]|nr:hypothetical protein BLOT_005453 [Blomia tropicalis]
MLTPEPASPKIGSLDAPSPRSESVSERAPPAKAADADIEPVPPPPPPPRWLGNCPKSIPNGNPIKLKDDDGNVPGDEPIQYIGILLNIKFGKIE